MQNIERNIYMKKVIPFIGKNLIKVITGQRRTGKSFFLKQIIEYILNKNPEIQIIYINKEDFEFDSIKTYSDLIKYVENTSKNKNVALFIDEIQDIEAFERALRHFLLNDNFDIYCTGSNSTILSSDISTLLSGRTIEIEVFSLSYQEFLSFHKFQHSNESFNKYLIYGGMPNLIHLPLNDEIVYNYLKNVFNTIIVRDVIERHKIRNAVFLRNLCQYLADNTGSLVSGKKISDYLKSQRVSISPSIVLEYLSYLSEAYFIFQVKRSDLQGKKILETNEKYYFNDIGLRNSLIGYRTIDIGKIYENIAFMHLKIAGYEITIGEDRTKEIDFVAKKNNETIYVQVCYKLEHESTLNREFGNLLKIRNSYPKYVVSGDISSKASYEGIKHLHIAEFCKKIISDI